jgi:hypothetical protein
MWPPRRNENAPHTPSSLRLRRLRRPSPIRGARRTSAYAINEWNSSNIQNETLLSEDIKNGTQPPLPVGALRDSGDLMRSVSAWARSWPFPLRSPTSPATPRCRCRSTGTTRGCRSASTFWGASGTRRRFSVSRASSSRLDPGLGGSRRFQPRDSNRLAEPPRESSRLSLGSPARASQSRRVKAPGIRSTHQPVGNRCAPVAFTHDCGDDVTAFVRGGSRRERGSRGRRGVSSSPGGWPTLMRPFCGREETAAGM